MAAASVARIKVTQLQRINLIKPSTRFGKYRDKTISANLHTLLVSSSVDVFSFNFFMFGFMMVDF